MAAENSGRVQSLERAIGLLRAVATGGEKGVTIAEAADACGINRATAWRLFATLDHHEFVCRDRSTGRYAIGPGIARLAGRSESDLLVGRCRPVLERLSSLTGETASLAVSLPEGLTYVDEVVPESVIAVRWVGRRVSLYATSAGKAMLAWMGQSEIAAVLDAPLTGHTGATHTDRRALLDELETIRSRGYGQAAGELESGVNGVSAAILDADDRPIGIISVWGPADRLPETEFAALGELVVAAAAELRPD
ncbi:IclR family transcriptional regulator [Brevibacterium sanguinis]|uniref:IclR family transcriptional regulator n=2 Tax=Brevibacterium TaxID=1696 RepID=A0A366ID45_9MICO|nr:MULTISPECIES: IclR family transcriptional regulator [Brevibacterium]RBP62418.1 IclR family transcriptional regulator [Brevibacterium sanguinis]RBP68807.1 IclR family transcriptional regulator [Brevibacterium celere]